MVKTYDTKCYELAQVFLSDEAIASTAERDRLADLLAKDIQTAIEDFMEYSIPAASRAA